MPNDRSNNGRDGFGPPQQSPSDDAAGFERSEAGLPDFNGVGPETNAFLRALEGPEQGGPPVDEGLGPSGWAGANHASRVNDLASQHVRYNPGEQYVDDGYERSSAHGQVDDGYGYEQDQADGGHVNDGYVNDGYVDDGFVDNGYANDQLQHNPTDVNYVDDRYEHVDGYERGSGYQQADGGYVDDGYVNDGYVDDGFVDNGYANDQHQHNPGEQYVDDGYGEREQIAGGRFQGYADDPQKDQPYFEQTRQLGRLDPAREAEPWVAGRRSDGFGEAPSEVEYLEDDDDWYGTSSAHPEAEARYQQPLESDEANNDRYGRVDEQGSDFGYVDDSDYAHLPPANRGGSGLHHADVEPHHRDQYEYGDEAGGSARSGFDDEEDYIDDGYEVVDYYEDEPAPNVVHDTLVIQRSQPVYEEPADSYLDGREQPFYNDEISGFEEDEFPQGRYDDQDDFVDGYDDVGDLQPPDEVRPVGHPGADRPKIRRQVPDGFETRGQRARRQVYEILLFAVPVLILVFVVRTFVVSPFLIPSRSMDPTLQVQDRVLVNKLSYRFGEISRGDLVVVHIDGGAGGEERDIIKRVMALPGETLEIKDNTVIINGESAVDETSYLAPGTESEDFGPITVPDNEIFLMGDNRGSSDDSRGPLGTVPTDDVVGRAFTRFWPPSRFGSL